MSSRRNVIWKILEKGTFSRWHPEFLELLGVLHRTLYNAIKRRQKQSLSYNLNIVDGAADLEWKRRSVAELYWKRWSAAELDWMWVPRWFEVRLEEKELESGTAESDLKRRSATNLRLWACHCLVLLQWVWVCFAVVWFLWLDWKKRSKRGKCEIELECEIE